MNKLLIDTVRSPLRHIATATLVVLGAGLAVSALVARTPAPLPAGGGQCINWPCKDSDQGCKQIRDSVAQVFTDLINKASNPTPDSQNLRQQLLDPVHGPGLAWGMLHDGLSKLVPPVPFGPEHTVIFYIPESYDVKATTPPVFPAPNHCMHILYLPQVTATPTPSPGSAQSPGQVNRNFHDNLMCCYKPW